MRLLFVASDAMEFPGILAHTTDARPADLPVDWSRTGKLGGHDVLLVANGVGARRAAAAVDAAAGKFRPDAVISTGFCGALDESLELADIVQGTCVESSGRQYPAATLPESGRCKSGVVCSVAHVARTAEEKRRLRSSGACAVEMEASGVAEKASALGTPFYCVRAVTDLAGETLANDFNAALRPDGHFDTIKLLKGALRHPTARLPELLRLRNRCARAARVLGEFFADCRF